MLGLSWSAMTRINLNFSIKAYCIMLLEVGQQNRDLLLLFETPPSHQKNKQMDCLQRGPYSTLEEHIVFDITTFS
uniref:Uncharacterized protein n=1 Tax=Aegilops tauschii subsp. strangulata TaxID=200361 RepID=A0A453R639_AEGTS